MKIVADFHIHSKYSRAVSKEMTLENLDVWAKKKGIHVMGTGDFTHPQWFKEISTKLEPAESDLYRLKGSSSPTRFMLTVEISSIYKKRDKARRIHNLIFAPSIEAVQKINDALSLRGNLRSDGRPILGVDSKDILKIALEAGLSSDPAMNWRLSKLDNISLISNSDSHSLERIGRESNVFDTDLSY